MNSASVSQCSVMTSHRETAAAGQSSGARKRCFSSLQVTYHQEIHKPVPRLVCKSQQPTHSLGISNYSSCDPTDQSLEEGDTYLQEGDLESHDNEQDDFYPQPLLLPAPSQPPLTHQECHQLQPMLQHAGSDTANPSLPNHPPPPPTVPSSLLPTPQPCYHNTPNNTLFGLEDGLRHRINIEIENFRASVQEIMREQFSSHNIDPYSYEQHQQYNHHSSSSSQHHNYTPKEERQDCGCEHLLDEGVNGAQSGHDDSRQSIETSIDSGVCVDGSLLTSPEATPTSIEEEMSLALIKLQTLSSIISHNLQPPDYTSSD